MMLFSTSSDEKARKTLWSIKFLLPLLVLMLVACRQNDEQKAIELARKVMTQTIGANAVNRAYVEVRTSAAGWQVIFRDAYANCEEGPFWPGACRFGPRTFRDVYACVDPNWMIHQVGASPATEPIGEQEVCSPGPTITPAPTDPAQ